MITPQDLPQKQKEVLMANTEKAIANSENQSYNETRGEENGRTETENAGRNRVVRAVQAEPTGIAETTGASVLGRGNKSKRHSILYRNVTE